MSVPESWRLLEPTTDLSIPGSTARLRPWQNSPADAAALVAAWTDTEILRWNNGPAAPTTATAKDWIAGCQRRLASGTALDLVIDLDGVAVGEVGMSGIDPVRSAGLIGYWVIAAHRGKGLASSATRAFSDWALGVGGFAMLVARCDQANTASQRTAASAGFAHEMTDPDGIELWVRRSESTD